MPVFKDQTRRTTFIDAYPKRIISLVPSQTELLADLGLSDEVVGITKFCVHPDEWFRSKTRVGGTKQLIIETIHALKPDLIIANKEENVKEQIEELEKHYPVWVSDVNNLIDAYEMIEQIGLITNKENKAKNIISNIKENFALLQNSNTNLQVIYLIWQKPYMTAGGDTFIHFMLEAAGFKNMYANTTRYPEVTIEELKKKNPDLIILSSEPFPFKQKHIDELQIHLPTPAIILADGEMFSWYGSRLLKAPAYFKKLYEQIVRT
ncbi:MAG: helical backbone metal receptor [Chitinophagaceae bacterium]